MPSSTSQARRCSSLALACLRVRRLVALLSAASCPFPLGVVMSEFVALVFRPLAMFRNRRPAPAVRVLSVLGSRAMVRQLTFAFVVLLFVVVVVVPLGATSPWETVGEQLCELDQLDASVRTPDDVTAFFALETFAMLPFVEGIGSSAPGADQAPVFQTLRTRLLTLGVGRVAKPAPEADGSISD